MKTFINILAFGALLVLNGVVAAPVYPPDVTVTVTVTRSVTKVYPTTCTEWVEPSHSAKPSHEHKHGHVHEHEHKSPYSISASTTATIAATKTTTPYKTSKTSTSSATTSTTLEVSSVKSTTPYTTTTSSTTTSYPSSTEVITSTPPTTIISTTSPEEYTTTSSSPAPVTTTSSTASVTVQLSQPTQVPQASSPSYSGSQSFAGDATYYAPGLGSCGVVNTDSDMICAVSHIVFDSYNTGNPNNNPLCGKKIKCTGQGGSTVTVIVTDRCVACKHGDLDFTPSAFEALGGTEAEGRFHISCEWLD